MDLGGVFIVFGNKVILWCRSSKVSESVLDAFWSLNVKEFGEIRIGVKMNHETHKSHKEKLILQNGFDDNIVSITLFPWISNDYLSNMIDMGVKWFILRWYGTGDVPEYIYPFFRKAREHEIPIIIATQCGWSTSMWVYIVGLDALKFGVIESYDMSIESITTKLMRCIRQWIPYKDLKHMMQHNIHWEISMTHAKSFRNKVLQKTIEEMD
jgi:glutamyl-tRNA(Gln) amidotransferase subunit D